MVEEQTYYRKHGTLRPFKLSSGVNSRGYSSLLQRAMVDFGADESFAKAIKKIKEHYKIDIPISSERCVTMFHANIMKDNLNLEVADKNKRSSKRDLAQRAGNDFIVSETDGSMVPIVATKNGVKDKRKKKEVMYREARLTLAHKTGSKSSVFSATFSDTNTVGKHIRYCVDKAGCGANSKIHAVGDGAPWIAEQVDIQFGSQAKYLIDFYHASEYLAAASRECAVDNPKKWLHTQQQLLKVGRHNIVLNHLKEFAMVNEGSATNKCYHYLKRRLHQLHYDEAIKHDLPIGSGEIESAHRYIIQNRLKIQGAWWLLDNAESMINLSICIANDNWDGYWDNYYAA